MHGLDVYADDVMAFRFGLYVAYLEESSVFYQVSCIHIENNRNIVLLEIFTINIAFAWRKKKTDRTE